MKRIFITCITLILCITILTSCNSHRNENEKDTIEPTNNSTKQESIFEGNASMNYPIFPLYADFEKFCESGEIMNKNAYIDIFELFPDIKEELVFDGHVEIVHSKRYAYIGDYTEEKIPFIIAVTYIGDRNDEPIDCLLTSEEKEKYRIIYEDYFKTPKSEEHLFGFDNLSRYIFKINDCWVKYSAYKEELRSISILMGDYIVDVGIGTKDNKKFFTDESLKSLNCLFTDGEEREKRITELNEKVKEITEKQK